MTGLKLAGLGFVTAFVGTAANATAYDFNFKTNTTVGSATYVDADAKYGEYLSFSDTTNGSTVNLQVYGGHINSAKTGALNTVSTAVVADWRGYGLGVSFDKDTTSNETHQIDNSGDGTDFVALVFDQAVSISNFGVVAYAMNGAKYIDYDLSYVAYAGTLADLVNGVNTSTFKTVNANGATYGSANSAASTSLTSTISTTGSATSSIWLISAAIANPDTKLDGFKLTSLALTAVPAAVPEPATWAMMLVGFGAIGSTLRSRRGRSTMNAAIGG